MSKVNFEFRINANIHMKNKLKCFLILNYLYVLSFIYLIFII